MASVPLDIKISDPSWFVKAQMDNMWSQREIRTAEWCPTCLNKIPRIS